MLSVVATRTLVVLGMQSLRTSKLKKTNKTFDDVKWILTIIWVALECRVSTRISHLCHGTWLIRILTKAKEGVQERGSRDGSSLAYSCSTHRVELCRQSLGIVLLEIKGHALPSEYQGSEQSMMLGTPHMILGMCLKWSSHCVTSVSHAV
jgi:hypothetical protein